MDTRTLLRCGVVAGPFYLIVGVAQGLLRDGFSFARHPLSVLANGSLGWIQTTNFVLSSLLVIAAAVGFRRVLGPKSRGLTWTLFGYALGMLVAAAFPADPMDGFPPGTPLAVPGSISTTGLTHFVAGAFTFVCLALGGLFGAWTLWRRNLRPLAWLSLFSGLCVLFGFFGGIALPVGTVGIWFAVVVGWAWLSVLSLLTPRPAS